MTDGTYRRLKDSVTRGYAHNGLQIDLNIQMAIWECSLNLESKNSKFTVMPDVNGDCFTYVKMTVPGGQAFNGKVRHSYSLSNGYHYTNPYHPIYTCVDDGDGKVEWDKEMLLREHLTKKQIEEVEGIICDLVKENAISARNSPHLKSMMGEKSHKEVAELLPLWEDFTKDGFLI